MSDISKKEFPEANGAVPKPIDLSFNRQEFTDWLRQQCEEMYSDDDFVRTGAFFMVVEGVYIGRDDYCLTDILPRFFAALSPAGKVDFTLALRDVVSEWAKDERANMNIPGRWWTLKERLDDHLKDFEHEVHSLSLAASAPACLSGTSPKIS